MFPYGKLYWQGNPYRWLNMSSESGDSVTGRGGDGQNPGLGMPTLQFQSYRTE